MGTTSVRMPDELLQRLEQAAAKLRRSKGWIIKDAVEAYLAREERKAQRLEETREALADIENGQVVSGDEILEWLESWGTENEKVLPKP